MSIKLIVGLANPGTEYATTRHNAGAWYVELLAKKCKKTLKYKKKFFGQTTYITLVDKNIHLLVPATFMNLSGKSVVAMAKFYHIKHNEILVIHDELDLLPGYSRLKFSGGHGGHNGLKSIIECLDNNPQFYRLRIGIGQPSDKNKITSFILETPPTEELKLINCVISEAIRCTETFITQDIIKAMNRLHAYHAD